MGQRFQEVLVCQSILGRSPAFLRLSVMRLIPVRRFLCLLQPSPTVRLVSTLVLRLRSLVSSQDLTSPSPAMLQTLPARKRVRLDSRIGSCGRRVSKEDESKQAQAARALDVYRHQPTRLVRVSGAFALFPAQLPDSVTYLPNSVRFFSRLASGLGLNKEQT